MASISTIAGNSSLMYKIAAKGLAGSTKNSSYQSLLGLSSQNRRTWSSSRTAPSYSYAQTANAMLEQRKKLNTLVKDYSNTSDAFYKEFSRTTSPLKNASRKLSTTNFHVKGSTDEVTKKNVQNVLSNVKEFVSAYNDTNDFFRKNKDVSHRMGSLANSFADNTYRASTLSRVGIKVDQKTGNLSIDEKKLTESLKSNAEGVSYALGKTGLTGKADRKLQLADMQKDKLFPSISSMLGGSSLSSVQSIYSAKTTNAVANYSRIGSFIDMYF